MIRYQEISYTTLEYRLTEIPSYVKAFFIEVKMLLFFSFKVTCKKCIGISNPSNGNIKQLK